MILKGVSQNIIRSVWLIRIIYIAIKWIDIARFQTDKCIAYSTNDILVNTNLASTIGFKWHRVLYSSGEWSLNGFALVDIYSITIIHLHPRDIVVYILITQEISGTKIIINPWERYVSGVSGVWTIPSGRSLVSAICYIRFLAKSSLVVCDAIGGNAFIQQDNLLFR